MSKCRMVTWIFDIGSSLGGVSLPTVGPGYSLQILVPPMRNSGLFAAIPHAKRAVLSAQLRKRTITVFPFSSRVISNLSFSAFTSEESEAWP